MTKTKQPFLKPKDLIYNERKTVQGKFTPDLRVKRLRPRKKT